jgi:hypothetical protein
MLFKKILEKLSLASLVSPTSHESSAPSASSSTNSFESITTNHNHHHHLQPLIFSRTSSPNQFNNTNQSISQSEGVYPRIDENHLLGSIHERDSCHNKNAVHFRNEDDTNCGESSSNSGCCMNNKVDVIFKLSVDFFYCK